MIRLICIVFLMLTYSLSISAAVMPAPEYVPGELIVKIKRAGFSVSAVSTNALSSVYAKYGAKVVSNIKTVQKGTGVLSVTGPDVQLIAFDPVYDIAQVKSDIGAQNNVEYAEPNYYVAISSVPNDPHIEMQGYLKQVDVDKAWNVMNYAHSHPIVAVLDTGVDYNHADLKDDMWVNTDEVPGNGIDDDDNGFVDDIYGYDFYNYHKMIGDSNPSDEYGHGTHVAGIMAGVANNQLGIAGIAWDARIMAIKFMDNTGRGTQYDAAQGIYYAVDNGARVINCSWGYFSYNTALYDAIKYAVERGVFVVASAGNNNWDIKQYPAAFPEVIAVAALDKDNNKAYFSNYGDYVDIAAPGMMVYSTYPGSSYVCMTGTSQASPIVAGIIAMLISYKPDIVPADIRRYVYNLATDLKDAVGDGEVLKGWDQYSGYGMINAYKSILAVNDNTPEINTAQTNAVVVLSLTRILNYPNPASSITEFGFELGGAQSDISVTIYDIYGKKVRTVSAAGLSIGYSKVSWDLTDDKGQQLANGTYLYIITASGSLVDGKTVSAKQKLSILR